MLPHSLPSARQSSAADSQLVHWIVVVGLRIVVVSNLLLENFWKLDGNRGAQSALTNCVVLFMDVAVLDATFTNSLSSVIAAASEFGFRLFDFSEFIRTPERNLLWLVEAAFIRRNGIPAGTFNADRLRRPVP
jgi:hypothetical protein